MAEVFTLGAVETKSGVSKAGTAWQMWKLKDTAGQDIGATFTAGIGGAAQGLVGQTVEVDREHGDRGWKVNSVRPAAGQAATPAPASPAQGADEQKWREKERRDLRSRAWAQALATLAQIGALSPDMSAKDIHDRSAPLAGAIFLSVAGPEFAANTLPGASGPDDSIPFAASWA